MNELEFCVYWVGNLTPEQIKVVEQKVKEKLFFGIGRGVGELNSYPTIRNAKNLSAVLIINESGNTRLASQDGLMPYSKTTNICTTREKPMPEKNYSGETVLFQYIKKGQNRKKVGMFYAVKWQESQFTYILLGHSLCNPKDKFSKEKAFSIAQGRALSQNSQRLPPSLEQEFNDFHTRCKKFFKGTKFLENYYGYVLQDETHTGIL